MMELSWLFAAPVAHRGLHDRTRGIIENTAPAAAAAVARGYAIECDVQRTADGEAVVFHDFVAERLTTGSGRVADMTAAALGATPLRDTADRVPTLQNFLHGIGDRAPVVVEVKSAFDGDMRLADRTAEIVAGTACRTAIKSFDPAVVAHLRNHRALAGKPVPRGLVAEAVYDGDPVWASLSAATKRELSQFLHFDHSRPDFVSYCGRDLPHAAPHLCRTALGLPVMAWTIRSCDEAQHALRWADQIVFEGFDPVTR